MPGALAALERARKLDPMSAELSAELAGFYSRQNRLIDAVVVAEQALKLDKNNVEAHNVLGLVYVAWADGAVPLPPGHTQAAARASAIEHLSAIPEGPQFHRDAQELRNALLELRQAMASGGWNPSVGRQQAQVDALLQRLVDRTARVSRGQIGPNNARIIRVRDLVNEARNLPPRPIPY